MKILQVFDFLSLPHGGGTVDIVHRLSSSLAKRGHDVTICIGDYELDNDYINLLGNVHVKIFKSYFNKHGFFIMPSLNKLDVREYDVIHLHCYRSFQNAVIIRKAIKDGIPYIIDAHGSTVESNGNKKVVHELYDKVIGYESLREARRVIAETEVGVAEYKRLGVDLDKINLLHPMIDISEFELLPPKGLFKKKYNINGNYVLFIGRIHQAKGIETLVEAVSRLEDVSLVIVGQDDGFKSKLDKIIFDKGLSERVLFTGFLTGYAKLAALVDASALIQPSKNEAGARPSLEAILCDTPVIVTRNTGAGKELAKFNGGDLFDYGDVEWLTQYIWSILKCSGKSNAKTLRAKEYIRSNLALNRQIIQYEELYNEVV